VITEASVPAGRAGLADSLAELSRLRDPGALGAAITRAAGRVLGLDAVAFVRLSPEGITCDGRWARPGARPNRVGEARMAMAVEMCEDAGGTVAQRVFGRLQLVAIPVHVDGAISHVLAGTARPNRVLTEAELADAAAIGAHAGACMEMMAAVTAAREYMLLEQAIAPPAGTRGDRALEQMQLVQSSSAALMGARSYSEVGQVVVNQLRTLIDYQSCRFYVLSPDGDTLEPVALLGIGTAYGDSPRRPRLRARRGHHRPGLR
jgi:hypothetical protein